MIKHREEEWELRCRRLLKGWCGRLEGGWLDGGVGEQKRRVGALLCATTREGREGLCSLRGGGLLDHLDSDAFDTERHGLLDGDAGSEADVNALDVVVDIPASEVGGEDVLDGELEAAEVAE